MPKRILNISIIIGYLSKQDKKNILLKIPPYTLIIEHCKIRLGFRIYSSWLSVIGSMQAPGEEQSSKFCLMNGLSLLQSHPLGQIISISAMVECNQSNK